MGKKNKVAFATGSRADYGIVRRYLDMLNKDESIDLSILTTGAILDEKYGKAEKYIVTDGFKIDYKCTVSLKNGKVSDTIHTMAEVLDKFGKYFQNNPYDLVIILGDRYEIFSISIAAAMQRIPILHIHGGEITVANYDEFIRHSITKMSRFHFTSTEEYRNRVIQLGEYPETVFNLGALGAENCLAIDESNVLPELFVLPSKKCFTVLYHPETLNEQSPLFQIQQLLKAVANFLCEYKFIFLGSNSDTSSNIIKNEVKLFCNENKNALYYENLHPDGYHYLVKKSIALIGNSSSGIIEVPSLGSFTINIGNRQTGRVKGDSVIDVQCKKNAIVNAISEVLLLDNSSIQNPYYIKNSAEEYYKKTMKILKEISNLSYKHFYDL